MLLVKNGKTVLHLGFLAILAHLLIAVPYSDPAWEQKFFFHLAVYGVWVVFSFLLMLIGAVYEFGVKVLD